METPIARSNEISEGRITYRESDAGPLVLSRVNGVVRALDARCPHIGYSLKRGKVDHGIIECPWHGSRFDMRDGHVVGWVHAFAGKPMPRWTHRIIKLGREPRDARCVPVEERDGAIYLDHDD